MGFRAVPHQGPLSLTHTRSLDLTKSRWGMPYLYPLQLRGTRVVGSQYTLLRHSMLTTMLTTMLTSMLTTPRFQFDDVTATLSARRPLPALSQALQQLQPQPRCWERKNKVASSNSYRLLLAILKWIRRKLTLGELEVLCVFWSSKYTSIIL